MTFDLGVGLGSGENNVSDNRRHDCDGLVMCE